MSGNHTFVIRSGSERGVALVMTMLVMALMAALMIGFTAVVMSDQRYRFIDRDRGQAFYAASGGLEKLTADLGNLFLTAVAPTQAQLTALTTTAAQPVISGITFTAPLTPDTLPTSSLTRCVAPNAVATVGAPGYTLRYCATPNGTPTTSTTAPIKTGPYEGLIALQMPFQLDVSARTATKGETHLVRSMEAVADPGVPVRHLLRRRSVVLRRTQLQLRRARAHQRQPVSVARHRCDRPGRSATRSRPSRRSSGRGWQNGVSIRDTPAPAHAGDALNMAQSPGVFRPLAPHGGQRG